MYPLGAQDPLGAQVHAFKVRGELLLKKTDFPSFVDFAKALRLPTVVIRPASLRIYRNSTARYATQ
jgi:hypothetical protein